MGRGIVIMAKAYGLSDQRNVFLILTPFTLSATEPSFYFLTFITHNVYFSIHTFCQCFKRQVQFTVSIDAV